MVAMGHRSPRRSQVVWARRWHRVAAPVDSQQVSKCPGGIHMLCHSVANLHRLEGHVG